MTDHYTLYFLLFMTVLFALFVLVDFVTNTLISHQVDLFPTRDGLHNIRTPWFVLATRIWLLVEVLRKLMRQSTSSVLRNFNYANEPSLRKHEYFLSSRNSGVFWRVLISVYKSAVGFLLGS